MVFFQIYWKNYDNEGNENENVQYLKKLEHLWAKINTKSCKARIDELINTKKIIHIIGYRILNKSLTKKIRRNDDLDDHYIKASYFLKEIVSQKIKNENRFTLITGPYKTNPHKKIATRNYLTPWLTNK